MRADILPRFITSDEFTKLASKKAEKSRKDTEHRNLGFLHHFVHSSQDTEGSGKLSPSKGSRWKLNRSVSKSSSIGSSPRKNSPAGTDGVKSQMSFRKKSSSTPSKSASAPSLEMPESKGPTGPSTAILVRESGEGKSEEAEESV